MAREYARWRLSMWDDDDYTDLSPEAQHLYGVLVNEPALSSCGRADWRPARLLPKARGWRLETVLRAAAELENRRFVLFDLDTEEALVRGYIRNDELLRNPKMALSVIKSYGALASRKLRAVVISELKRAREDQSEYSSWTSPLSKEQLARLLTRPDLESVPYTNVFTFDNGNENTNDPAVSNTNGTPIPTGVPNTNENTSRFLPSANNHQPSALQPSANVGYVSTEGHQRATPDDEPPPRCPKHLDHPTEAPCIPCRARRIENEAWHADRKRQAAEAKSAYARRTAELRAAAIDACDLCDDDGQIGRRICDHDPGTVERASRGSALVRAALAKGGLDDE